MNIIIPMAGAGSRFVDVGITIPKPLIEVMGVPLVEHAVNSFNVSGTYVFITRKTNSDDDIKLSETLTKLRPESKHISLNKLTSGPVESVLEAAHLIDNDEPLVIFNCDQLIKWDSNDILNYIKETDPQSLIVLYNSVDPKNSFAVIEDGLVKKLVEKKPVSNNALIGFHYWKHGKDFVKSAKLLMKNFREKGTKECYISESFNYLESSISPYFIANPLYVPLGTPEDIQKYIGKEKEYDVNKPKTLFIDIDGTILKHQHAISGVYQNKAAVLDGVIDKFDNWDSSGYRIILTTGRKESARTITEKQLDDMQISYDMLIMGVGTGKRILINDKLEETSPDRAQAINVITDHGFNNISWEDYGL